MATDVFVFRIGQFGDTLVALPAIHRIAELHPGARLWLITNAPARSTMVTAWHVLEDSKLFEGALFYDSREPLDLLRLALRLRNTEDPVLYYLSPARRALQLWRDRLFLRVMCGVKNIRAMPAPTAVTLRNADGTLRVLPRESERLLRSVDPAHDANWKHDGPLLQPPSAATRRVSELLAGVAERPLIAVGPGSKMPAKRWFLPRYIEVCRRILQQHAEAALVILGDGSDREAGAEILAALGRERVVNLAGQTSISECAAALARCSLYLGNDTGTMHLAASMAVPCIALFTSRDNRDVWSPWGEGHSLLRRELACSGCMLEACEREQMRCLDLITVDDVWREVSVRLPYLRAPAPVTITITPNLAPGS